MSASFSDWGESNEPQDQDVNFRWRIRRPSHLKIVRFAIVSAKHYGVYTHFFRGRTTPHLNRDCDACADGHLPRWYGFLLAVASDNKQHVVLQYPAGVASIVADAEHTRGDLRRSILQASRPAGRENSPVHLEFLDKLYSGPPLPDDEELRPVLAHIWGFREGAAIPAESQPLNNASDAIKVASGLRGSEIHDLPGQMNFLHDVNALLVGIGRPDQGAIGIVRNGQGDC